MTEKGYDISQLRPLKTNSRFGLDPKAAARINRDWEKMEKPGYIPPENPVIVAGEKIYKHLKSLEEAVFIDKMTGLSNRNAWIDVVQHFDHRRGDTATIVICDINGLKEINDNIGHSSGDTSIKTTADALQEIFHRTHDHIARIGGDEFGILIEDNKTPEDQENFEKYIEDKLSPESQKNLGIDISYGIAHFDPNQDLALDVLEREDDKNYQTTFDRADAAMYEYKKAWKAQHPEKYSARR